ncbi:LruC domain-containing protein [Pedobacter sp. SD-b]|uniref:LruC domain-containing protein n=1 Tax=Pedobacter segetis TaxID=2793069 RepID=A0ABS1BM93_9SPHI|nr:LruC domain-containing protein [Pedobacter segetis]MBK0384014.1 LruC domain-containing protein [Pedobacter segetis]
MKKIFTLVFLSFATQAIFAQRPVTLDCESGNRNNDAAVCWEFPGTIHSSISAISGKYSSRTGPLSDGIYFPDGVKSPWMKFDGTGSIKWKMKLEKWTDVKYREFALIKVAPDDTTDTIFRYDFTSANAENIYNGNIKINFSGIYKLKFFFIGEGGTTRGILDDIIIDGTYWSSPSNSCNPIAPDPQNGDDDGDGVPNNKDAYPKDPTLAFECYYPANIGNGTLMFEDLWPKKGDYDLNDLVAEYKIRFRYNSKNILVDAEMEIALKALGAGNSNGLMYQFDKIKSDQIESVTGSKITGNIVTLAPNGVESGQKYANILIFDNGNAIMPNGDNARSNVTNVEPNSPYIIPQKVIVDIVFKTDAAHAVHYTDLNFNPYLIANQKRGVEIHLPGFVPSDKADKSIFGTYDDDTHVSTKKYYQTRDNLPWAIDINTEIPYLQEQKEITTGYSKFLQWALSNGKQFNDWYLNKPGYRNNGNLYIR